MQAAFAAISSKANFAFCRREKNKFHILFFYGSKRWETSIRHYMENKLQTLKIGQQEIGQYVDYSTEFQLPGFK